MISAMEKEKKGEKEVSAKHRCFVAVEIPDGIKKKIAPLLQELSLPGVKSVSVDNLHITLKFLGYLQKQQLEKVKQLFRTIQIHSFSFSVKGVGCFPTEKRPRVVWIACENVEFEKLAEEINAVLAPLFPKEAFTAHVTIARVKDLKNSETRDKIQKFIAKHKNDVFGTVPCKDFVLKESQLRKSGSIYSTIETFSFR